MKRSWEIAVCYSCTWSLQEFSILVSSENLWGNFLQGIFISSFLNSIFGKLNLAIGPLIKVIFTQQPANTEEACLEVITHRLPLTCAQKVHCHTVWRSGAFHTDLCRQLGFLQGFTFFYLVGGFGFLFVFVCLVGVFWFFGGWGAHTIYSKLNLSYFMKRWKPSKENKLIDRTAIKEEADI